MGTTNSLLVTKLYQNRVWCWSIDWFNWLFSLKILFIINRIDVDFCSGKTIDGYVIGIFNEHTRATVAIRSMQFRDILACVMCSIRSLLRSSLWNCYIWWCCMMMMHSDGSIDSKVKTKILKYVLMRRMLFRFFRIDISFVCNVRFALNFYI